MNHARKEQILVKLANITRRAQRAYILGNTLHGKGVGTLAASLSAAKNAGKGNRLEAMLRAAGSSGVGGAVGGKVGGSASRLAPKAWSSPEAGAQGMSIIGSSIGGTLGLQRGLQGMERKKLNTTLARLKKRMKKAVDALEELGPKA